MIKLSILVISKTSFLLDQMISSLIDATQIDRNNIEILCSWNGSIHDMKSIKNDSFKHFEIKHVLPYHFASNMNNLIDRAKGEFILLINDDVYLDPSSIDNAIQFYKDNSHIGLIGGRLRDKSGYLMHSGLLFNILHLPYHFLEGLIRSDHAIAITNNYPISAVTGALMLISSEKISDVRFNNKYSICGEDIELCLDIREKLNYDIFYCHKFSGIHESESTRRYFANQKSSLKDKILLAKRYRRFIWNSNISNLINEYSFNKKILMLYFKFNINVFKTSKNTKWNLLIIIPLIYFKTLIIIRKIFKMNS